MAFGLISIGSLKDQIYALKRNVQYGDVRLPAVHCGHELPVSQVPLPLWKLIPATTVMLDGPHGKLEDRADPAGTEIFVSKT